MYGTVQTSRADIVRCLSKSSPAASAFSTPEGEVRVRGVRFGFCGKPETYTPVFMQSPSENTASVNAGDYNLYVGGGAINKAFQVALQLPGNNGYQRLHELMLEEAQAAPGRLASPMPDSPASRVAAELGLVGCFARVMGEGAGPATSGRVSAVFIDVFAAGRRPLDERNVAMLYVVGPKGHGAPGGHGPTIRDRGDFLRAVEDLGANSMLALQEYNDIAETRSLPKVDAVQWCLVSGGVYRHEETEKLDVAVATVNGLLSGASTGPAGGLPPLFRFAYDEGVFEKAVALLQK